MDNFDDLLASNPFSDPFKRSSSPDPWATPFSDSEQGYSAFTSEESPTADTTEQSPVPDEGSTTPTAVAAALADPLDSANIPNDEDDDNEPLGRRKSVIIEAKTSQVTADGQFSEIATIRPAGPEETIPAPESPRKPADSVAKLSPSPSSPSKESATIPSTQPGLPELSTPGLPSPAAHRRTESLSQSLSSPGTAGWGGSLESQGPTLSHSLGADALAGGFSSGGWQGDGESWANDRTVTVSTVSSEDDSDDDKPIGQIVREHGSNPGSPARQQRNQSDISPVFVITVDDPQKVGDPIRSFTMYTVHTRTTSPLFKKSAFSVLRRYSDFLWLYETLSLNNPGVVVPPVPEKNAFGRFGDQFLKQRRYGLEKCIQKMANHPELGKDQDLKLFLESDTFALDIKQRKAEIAHERGGIMASIGQAVAGPKFYETDEWYDRQKVYLDSLESQLKGLVKAIDLVAKHRADVSLATGDFAQNVSELAASDVGKNLSQALSGLADIQRKAQDFQNVQSEQDITTLNGTVDEYARLINSVRLAFNSRIRTYQNWKKADDNLYQVKQNHERNRAQGKIPAERLGFSLSQIADAERRALESKHEFEHVSKLIKSELARFEEERIEDFRDSLHAFLEGMISRQKDLIEAWENYQQMLLKRVGGGRGLDEDE